jgi:hypothetical protein
MAKRLPGLQLIIAGPTRLHASDKTSNEASESSRPKQHPVMLWPYKSVGSDRPCRCEHRAPAFKWLSAHAKPLVECRRSAGDADAWVRVLWRSCNPWRESLASRSLQAEATPSRVIVGCLAAPQNHVAIKGCRLVLHDNLAVTDKSGGHPPPPEWRQWRS